MLGFPETTAEAIRTLDEHWDGRGYPLGLGGDAIPPFGRVVCLAQTVEVFFTVGGLDLALDVAAARRSRWFDPALVSALDSLRSDHEFWSRLGTKNLLSDVVSVEPPERVRMATLDRLDTVARALARVRRQVAVDAAALRGGDGYRARDGGAPRLRRRRRPRSPLGEPAP